MRSSRRDQQALCENERLSLYALSPATCKNTGDQYFHVCEKTSGTTLLKATIFQDKPLACITQAARWLCPDVQKEALALICDYTPDAPRKQAHQYQKLCRLYETLGLGKPEPHQPVHPEACRLQPAGQDCFGRSFMLHPDALLAYRNMWQAAYADGISLVVVSAYRSFAYQTELIRRKLAAGQRLHDIFRINAMPGDSEHHSGCALDLHCPTEKNVPPLSEDFEKTQAFDWLMQHAERYGFSLSYPRQNPQGMIYEPWHWCYRLAPSE